MPGEGFDDETMKMYDKLPKSMTDMGVDSGILIPVSRKSAEFNKINNKEIILTCTFAFTEHWFCQFVSSCFGDYEITTFGEDNVRHFGSEVVRKWESKKDIEIINQQIETFKANAIEKIKSNTEIPDERKDNLLDIVSTIKYSGTSFKNDPITKSNLTWLLEDFDVADEILPVKQLFKNLMEKVPLAKDNLGISINNKNIIINDGRYKRQARLSEDEQLSLNVFFGVEDE